MQDCPLGQPTVYVETYAPELLFPVPRTMARDRTGIPANFPFYGEDIWNGYEISWLNERGKPQIATAEFRFPCNSPFLIESKSFKLYLNSFNQSIFPSMEAVEECIHRDISKIAKTDVFVRLMDPCLATDSLQNFSGHCLDLLDVEIDTYHVNSNFLRTGTNSVRETLYTDLLKSNCLATGQPDWGSVAVTYIGPQIEPQGLLKYFISYRQHAGFAEHCIEQIYFDISSKCNPTALMVYGRYTRRGGLDINPYRSSHPVEIFNLRQPRQ